ncbi:hypothetical protein ACEPAG_857 [Sanghuangporus baumii]
MANAENPIVVSNDQTAAPAAPEQQQIEPRHSFYETESTLTLEIFDKGANPEDVSIKLEPRAFTYQNGQTKKLVLQPLKGEIDPDTSSFTIGKVKVEVKFAKRALGRWATLVGDTPDVLASTTYPTPVTPPQEAPARPKQRKNWDNIASTILSSDKEKSLNEDPNIGGDSTVNGFFQQLYSNADEDTRKAMMKSYIESNGTTLSTNWDEVKKGKVEGKAPEGSVMKKWDS